MLFSIIICTSNREEEFKQCILSIANQSYRRFEVIVVDQNEKDKIRKCCSKYDFIRHLKSKDRGLSFSRNLGLKYARGDYILFPDDDCILASNFLEESHRLLSDGGCDLLSGVVLSFDTGLPLKRFSRMRLCRVNYKNYDLVKSAAMVVRKEAINIINGFDERLGVGRRWGGSEETDLLLRILHNKGNACFAPSIHVYHPSQSTIIKDVSGSRVIYRGYSYGLGRGAMYRKHYSVFSGKWAIRELCLSILKSILVVFISLSSVDKKLCLVDFSLACGKLMGFFTFKDDRDDD